MTVIIEMKWCFLHGEMPLWEEFCEERIKTRALPQKSSKDKTKEQTQINEYKETRQYWISLVKVVVSKDLCSQ